MSQKKRIEAALAAYVDALDAEVNARLAVDLAEDKFAEWFECASMDAPKPDAMPGDESFAKLEAAEVDSWDRTDVALESLRRAILGHAHQWLRFDVEGTAPRRGPRTRAERSEE